MRMRMQARSAAIQNKKKKEKQKKKIDKQIKKYFHPFFPFLYNGSNSNITIEREGEIGRWRDTEREREIWRGRRRSTKNQ